MFKRFFSSQLILGSLIMMAGTLIGGLASYLYHLLMGRMLGPKDYGLLASLISLSYLLNIPLGVINLSLVKFVSAFKGKNDWGSIVTLFKLGYKKILLFATIFLLIFLCLTPMVNKFLHISSSWPFLFIITFFFMSIFLTINRSFLQGLFKFGYFSFSNILESGLKLILAFFLVFLGYKIYGALGAILIGTFMALVFTFFPLRFLPRTTGKTLRIEKKEILGFALPVFFSTLAFTSLFGFDVVLVRHFFPDEQAGFYAALATLARIIYFLSFPVVSVMFPLISSRHASGVRYQNLLLVSFFLIFLVCFFLTGVYFLFPTLIVRLLFGQAYLTMASNLGFFGLFLSFYSLAFLLNNFFLSIKKTNVVFLPVIAALAQIIFIFLFHQNLRQVIWVSLIVTALLFTSLLLFLRKGQV